MQDISCLVLPIPTHAFFKQAVLQGEIGHDLLQGGGLATKVLHLARRRGAGRVARQPALAGLQELLRPAVIHSSEMLSSPRSPSSTMRIFSSAEYCRRV